MTSYTIHVDDLLWDKFREKTPRSKDGKGWTMNKEINMLIAMHCNHVEIRVEKKSGVQSNAD